MEMVTEGLTLVPAPEKPEKKRARKPNRKPARKLAARKSAKRAANAKGKRWAATAKRGTKRAKRR